MADLQVGLVIHDGVVQSKRQHQLHRRIATANTFAGGRCFHGVLKDEVSLALPFVTRPCREVSNCHRGVVLSSEHSSIVHFKFCR